MKILISYKVNILMKVVVFIKKEKKLVLISILILVVLVTVSLLFISFNYYKEELLSDTYANYNFGEKYGTIIYSDGTIKEFDDYNHFKKKKKDKITEEELTELKQLANKVKKDDYKEKDDDFLRIPDMGGFTTKIYNNQSKEWIILSDSSGSNTSEESQKILKLLIELKKKYQFE